MPLGLTSYTRFKRRIMTGSLRRYGTYNMDKFLDQVTRNTIGMDEYLSNVFGASFQETNYPPYNLIQINNTESRLELALAGFKKDEINVYTEYGKIIVKGEKNHKEEEAKYVSLSETLREHGHSAMTRKLDQLLLRMGY